MFASVRIFLAGIVSSINDLLFRSTRQVSGSVYDFELQELSGKRVKLAAFKGKYLLIVNTASRCGYTPQYADLQKLQDRYADKLVVLGFPSNDFLWQEPGSNEQIADFCAMNYGITFPMFEKISVTGKRVHPLFRWLRDKTGKAPAWNFCKFLIDDHGEIVGFSCLKSSLWIRRSPKRLRLE